MKLSDISWHDLSLNLSSYSEFSSKIVICEICLLVQCSYIKEGLTPCLPADFCLLHSGNISRNDHFLPVGYTHFRSFIISSLLTSTKFINVGVLSYLNSYVYILQFL